MTRGVPVLDPAVHPKGATPEKLAAALLRNPLRPLPKDKLQDRKVTAIMLAVFNEVREMCPTPKVWEKVLEVLISKVFFSSEGNFFAESDDLAGGTSNAIWVEFRPDKFRSFVTVTAEQLIAEAAALEEQGGHG